MKQDKVKKSGGGNSRNKQKQNERRKKALVRLQEQLKSGVKQEKNTHVLTASTTGNFISLTKEDVSRIEKEIETLNSRITNI